MWCSCSVKNSVIHSWALQRRASHNGALYKSSFLYLLREDRSTRSAEVCTRRACSLAGFGSRGEVARVSYASHSLGVLGSDVISTSGSVWGFLAFYCRGMGSHIWYLEFCLEGTWQRTRDPFKISVLSKLLLYSVGLAHDNYYSEWLTLKPGFHYPSWRVMETGYPSTRVVETGLNVQYRLLPVLASL